MSSASQAITMELRMVMLGNTGVGKSATANVILGRETFRETETTECELQRGRVDDRNISIIDTPGINSATLSSEQLKTEMRRLFSLSDPGPHMFLLLIRVGNFTEDQRNTVEWIQENFGEEALKFTMVLFTGREEMSSSQWKKFSEENRFIEFVAQCGGGYSVINSKKEANPAQITKLLNKIEKTVQLNRGQYYTNEIYQKIQRKNMEEEEKRSKEGVESERTLSDENLTPDEKLSETVPDSTKKQTNASTQKESTSDEQEKIGVVRPNLPITDSELRIVLLGKTGSGKSATGNTILKEKKFGVNSTFQHVTKRSARGFRYVNGRRVWVIDTPGLLNGVTPEDKMKEHFEEAIDLAHPEVHVFLLVIRLDIIFSREEINTVKWILENFGEEIQKHTIVFFTHGNVLKETIEQHLQGDKVLKEIVYSMAGYHVFENENEDDETQVPELLKKIDKVVDKNENQTYTKEMYSEVQRKRQGKFMEFAGVTGALEAAVLGVATLAAGGIPVIVAAATGAAAAIEWARGGKRQLKKKKLNKKENSEMSSISVCNSKSGSSE